MFEPPSLTPSFHLVIPPDRSVRPPPRVTLPCWICISCPVIKLFPPFRVFLCGSGVCTSSHFFTPYNRVQSLPSLLRLFCYTIPLTATPVAVVFRPFLVLFLCENWKECMDLLNLFKCTLRTLIVQKRDCFLYIHRVTDETVARQICRSHSGRAGR